MNPLDTILSNWKYWKVLVLSCASFLVTDATADLTKGQPSLFHYSHCDRYLHCHLPPWRKTLNPKLNLLAAFGYLPPKYLLRQQGMSSIMATDIVPLLDAIFADCVTFMRNSKTDSLRVALATTVSQYCDAVLEYLANKGLTRSEYVRTWIQFSRHAASAYLIIFSNWLPFVKDKQVGL
ncbi:unnamed protein product [Protopolystoma xenopodis]|uniref:MROH2B-like N-terminal HEAT-repeats domain-containing protein n=1 Tax=Protopolystoma xenopodis TaxID=117903 RepID=A0A3S4ZX68_9PLAT|nr:unnamed protein product [Protopolystoma xenopodis]